MIHDEILEIEQLVQNLPEKMRHLRATLHDSMSDLIKIRKAGNKVKKDMKDMGTLTELCASIGALHSILETYTLYLDEMAQEMLNI